MVCRCSSPAEHSKKRDYIKLEKKEVAALTPDASQFDVEEVFSKNNYLLLKVKYPSCVNCSYEGTKLLLFKDVQPFDPVKWKKIDPHFRSPSSVNNPKEAPSPIARFPASKEGWDLAITLINHLTLG